MLSIYSVDQNKIGKHEGGEIYYYKVYKKKKKKLYKV